MKGINRRIEDADFLWKHGRKESAFLLVLVAIASISRLRYPSLKDGDAFRMVLKDFRTISIRVEYRGQLESIEQIFYKWVRCQLIHEGELPGDIEFQQDIENSSMSIRAGGAPEYILKIGTGWFFHFINSVKMSKEMNGS